MCPKTKLVVEHFLLCEEKTISKDNRPFDYVQIENEWVFCKPPKAGSEHGPRFTVSINRWTKGYSSDMTEWLGTVSNGWRYLPPFNTLDEVLSVAREVAHHFGCDLRIRANENYGKSTV